MRTILLLTLLIVFGINNSHAQCGTPVQSFGPEGFDGGVFPTCWYSYGVATTFDRLNFNVYGNGDRWIVLPLVDNCKGILEFDARNATNGQVGFCGFQIGAVATQGASSMSTFELIETVNVYATISGNQVVYAHYTVDLSSYTGNSQYIAIFLPESPTRTGHIDNIEYESACISSGVTALTQDISVQLDQSGEAVITASDIDNGSSANCGVSLSIDVWQFDCDDIGPNTVTLTADDGQGNVETATATVTVLEAINNETVTASANEVCAGESTTITTGSSVAGVTYYLRDDADDSIVDGPITGTGSGLSLNTGSVTSPKTYNVFAETTTLATQVGALEFDGVDDFVDAPMPVGFNYNSSYTVEGWVKSPLPGASGGYQVIFFAGTTVASDIEVYIQQGTNGLVVVHNRGNGGTLQGATFAIPPNNTWFHLAIVYNGSTIEAFYDGVSQGSFAIPTPVMSTNANITFGYAQSSAFDPSWGSKNMLGSLDDFKLWSVARTSGEISSEMSNCAAGNESNLTAYFNFEEGSGTSLIDHVNSGNGILFNMDNSDWVTTGSISCTGQPQPACDKEMNDLVTVTVSPSYNLTESTAVCVGEMYTFPDGSVQAINSQTVHSSNLTTVVTGCDSIIETTVDVNPTYNLTETTSACIGDIYTFPDGSSQTINSQVVYTSNLQTIGFACDSVIETTVNATTIDASVTQNGNTLSASESGATYQWVDCDNGNAPIGGEISQDFTPSSSGNYAVEVTVNGCSETSGCTSMIVTGIHELTNSRINVYPVPANDVLFVNSTTSINEMAILAANGSLIKVDSQNKNQVDVSGLAKGIYLLQTVTDQGVSYTRFIKN